MEKLKFESSIQETTKAEIMSIEPQEVPSSQNMLVQKELSLEQSFLKQTIKSFIKLKN